jgi:MFS family permease
VTDSRIFYGWWVLAAGIAIVAVALGTLFSLAVFLKPLEEEFGWSRSLIAGIAFVNWLIFGAAGFLWGILSDRIGTRRVVALGAGLLGAAMLLSSRATTAGQLYAAFGVLGAAGASAFYVPLSATATRWFTARRGLALGLLNAGMGLGIMVAPPAARALVTALGWRPTMALFGLVAWTVGLLVVPWLYDRPADRGLTPYGAGAAEPTGRRPAPSATASEALRHPVFWLLAVVHFGCCLAHSGPIFHMVSHAIDLGVPKMAAAAMLGLSGATSIAGRIGSGLLADRFGAKRALVGMLSFQAATLSTYLVAAGELPLFLAALVFGMAYGGAMPLYALVAREFFGDRVIGTAFGGIFFVSTIGMGLGAVAGGLVFDQLGSYWSLHLASTVVGVAAVTTALLLRPPVASAVAAAGAR